MVHRAYGLTKEATTTFFLRLGVFHTQIQMSRQLKTGNKVHDLRQEIAALKRERAEANHERDVLLRNLKIRWANFKLEEAMSKLRRLI